MTALLADLRTRPFNYRPGEPTTEAAGWHLDRRAVSLPPEPPGEPIPDGSWWAARRVSEAYRFADPALVRGHFDPAEPLEGRTMALELRVWIARIWVGVRVTETHDEEAEVDGRPLRRAGWTYGTLAGHVERGERTFEARKWLDTGEVEFLTRAFSRPASRNPVMRIGFHLLGRPRQQRFVTGVVERTARLVRGEPLAD